MADLNTECFERALKVIPGGVNSPVRAFRHVGRTPVFFSRAEGPYLYDVEDQPYLDFCLAFGPHLLGHCPPGVVAAVQAQASRGMTFGACHPQEAELAEWILKSYPFLHKVRLVNSGTEAVMTAVRLARGFTGRPKILKFEGCFHGHSDGLLAKAGSGVAELSEADSQGIPSGIVQDTLVARYDSLEGIRETFRRYPGRIAAVILEPIPANYGLWIPPYAHIKQITELAKSEGALVIFDEVITGFRLSLGGATAYYDQRPDLVTLGKVIGGGLPMAAVVGRGEIMDRLAPAGGVYQAGTLAGNPLAVAAGLAVVRELHERRPLWNLFDTRCDRFVGELRGLFSKETESQIIQLGSIFWIHFGPETHTFPPQLTEGGIQKYRTLFKNALTQGLYLPPSPYEVCFLSFTHTEEVLRTALEKFAQCLPLNS
jgi:glutamate-1-semialdehyde 2,1-aminomutase